MSEHTKAPWPEFSEVRGSPIYAQLTEDDYAHARHRVNLHDELVAALERSESVLEDVNQDADDCEVLHRRVHDEVKETRTAIHALLAKAQEKP